MSKTPAKKSPYRLNDFLPMSREEAALRSWDDFDVILISGDAYVDHPSFGTAVLGRFLESFSLKVGIIAQPNWKGDGEDFTRLGKPRLFFGVSAGAMDSMVNHYTAAKKKRSDDAYTPGGKAGKRPDRAATVYTRILKKLYPDVPVILGGIEGSLRRLVHYDYWKDTVEASILASCPADLLIYGMGEEPLQEIVKLLTKGVPFSSLRSVRQCAYRVQSLEDLPKNKNFQDFPLESVEACRKNPKIHAQTFRTLEKTLDSQKNRRLIQEDAQGFTVVNPAFPPSSTSFLDAVAALPFTRMPHPSYTESIPAWDMIRHSVIMHRGCFGGCSFCAINAHQGKQIASRSPESIQKELAALGQSPDFNGTVSDLGGPTANMYKLGGKNQDLCKVCERPSCLWPKPCPNLNSNHEALQAVYKNARETPGIKHVYVASGIRYDLLFSADGSLPKDKEAYLRDLFLNHIPGRLKVAPEHADDTVLHYMRKPSFKLFRAFAAWFEAENRRLGKKQLLTPYFISSHPGSTLEAMARLAADTKELRFKLEQVQDLTPTPMTPASVMFQTGLDLDTLKPLYTPKSPKEKEQQKLFFFWYLEKNRAAIKGLLQSRGQTEVLKKLYPETVRSSPHPQKSPVGKSGAAHKRSPRGS